jgi:hypothetical protein
VLRSKSRVITLNLGTGCSRVITGRSRPGRSAGAARAVGNPRSRTFAELLIDREDDRMLRAVLVGMLREAELGR